MKLISIDEIASLEVTQQEIISSMLRTASMLVERGQLDRAAWRVADAGLMLRICAEDRGFKGQGIDEKTGFGSTLPRKTKK